VSAPGKAAVGWTACAARVEGEAGRGGGRVRTLLVRGPGGMLRRRQPTGTRGHDSRRRWGHGLAQRPPKARGPVAHGGASWSRRGRHEAVARAAGARAGVDWRSGAARFAGWGKRPRRLTGGVGTARVVGEQATWVGLAGPACYGRKDFEI
jgi:hypothetical protein